jgi:outer membrane lipoprotein-sorting protein
MYNIPKWGVVAILGLAFMEGYNNVLAKIKVDPIAKKILASIKIPKTFQATFSYHCVDETEGKSEAVKGQLWVKDSKYRIELVDQVIISNGAILWNYLPEVQELQINNVELEEEEAVVSFTSSL